MHNDNKGIFPGWWVVAAAFTALFVVFGALYCFAAFFRALESEFAASRADVSLIFSLAGFLYFAIGAITGSLADRFGTRLVVAAGMVLTAAGLFLASRADTLVGIYWAYGLGVGLGVGFVYVPAVGAVQRWFERKRGLASGIAVAGIGVGTLVVPPLASLLIEQAGWRGAYAVLAAAALLIGLGATALLEHSPERRGLQRDGIAPAGAAATAAPTGCTLGQALRSRPFWLLYGAGLATSFGIFIPFVHLAPFARDLGLTEQFGVLLVGLIGVGSVIGRFLLGGSADRIGRRRGLALMIFGLAAMMLLWLWASAPLTLVAFALLFGTFYGGFVALIPALTADYFGGRSVSSIIGFLYTSYAFGTLLGPTLAGLAFDLASSYTLPIVAAIVTNLLGLACVLLSAEPARFRASLEARPA